MGVNENREEQSPDKKEDKDKQPSTRHNIHTVEEVFMG